jgi:hypothetical protein
MKLVAVVYRFSNQLPWQPLLPQWQMRTGLEEEVQVYQGARFCCFLSTLSLVMEVVVAVVVQPLVGNLEVHGMVHRTD